jgi:hypothetical protein
MSILTHVLESGWFVFHFLYVAPLLEAHIKFPLDLLSPIQMSPV